MKAFQIFKNTILITITWIALMHFFAPMTTQQGMADPLQWTLTPNLVVYAVITILSLAGMLALFKTYRKPTSAHSEEIAPTCNPDKNKG